MLLGLGEDARSEPGMTDRMLKEASTVQEPLDVGTTVEDPPTELDGDKIARTSPMNVKRSVISLSL